MADVDHQIRHRGADAHDCVMLCLRSTSDANSKHRPPPLGIPLPRCLFAATLPLVIYNLLMWLRREVVVLHSMPFHLDKLIEMGDGIICRGRGGGH